MGVTIHYSGSIKDSAHVEALIKHIENYAARMGWDCRFFFEKELTLPRSGPLDEKGESQQWNYKGPAKIIRVMSHPHCEPLCFEIGDDLIFCGWVKTQFAPVDIHIAIVELFDSLKPFLNQLDVEDEGEYWESRDRPQLEHYITGTFDMIEQMRAENPHLTGPSFRPDGKIIDLSGHDGLSLPQSEAIAQAPSRLSRFQTIFYYAGIGGVAIYLVKLLIRLMH